MLFRSGLGNQFLSNIRECDAIIHVVRCFDDPNVVHVDGQVNPVRDKETIDTELQLKDLDSVEKKIGRMEKMAKAGGDKDAQKCIEALRTFKQHLEQGKPARSAPVQEEDFRFIADIFLLTAKPVLYVCNVDEGSEIGRAHV